MAAKKVGNGHFSYPPPLNGIMLIVFLYSRLEMQKKSNLDILFLQFFSKTVSFQFHISTHVSLSQGY